MLLFISCLCLLIITIAIPVWIIDYVPDYSILIIMAFIIWILVSIFICTRFIKIEYKIIILLLFSTIISIIFEPFIFVDYGFELMVIELMAFVMSCILLPVFYIGYKIEKVRYENKVFKIDLANNNILKQIEDKKTEIEDLNNHLNKHKPMMNLLELVKICGSDIYKIKEKPSFIDVDTLSDELEKKKKEILVLEKELQNNNSKKPHLF